MNNSDIFFKLIANPYKTKKNYNEYIDDELYIQLKNKFPNTDWTINIYNHIQKKIEIELNIILINDIISDIIFKIEDESYNY